MANRPPMVPTQIWMGYWQRNALEQSTQGCGVGTSLPVPSPPSDRCAPVKPSALVHWVGGRQIQSIPDLGADYFLVELGVGWDIYRP